MTVFIGFAIFAIVLIYFRYKFFFINNNYHKKLEEFIKANDFEKPVLVRCTFRKHILFHSTSYQLYRNPDFYILIKDFGLQNFNIHKLFPENYLVIIDDSKLKDVDTSFFLNLFKVKEIKGEDHFIGEKYTKTLINPEHHFEISQNLSISKLTTF
jgi:hypothetical protein